MQSAAAVIKPEGISDKKKLKEFGGGQRRRRTHRLLTEFTDRRIRKRRDHAPRLYVNEAETSAVSATASSDCSADSANRTAGYSMRVGRNNVIRSGGKDGFGDDSDVNSSTSAVACRYLK